MFDAIKSLMVALAVKLVDLHLKRFKKILQDKTE